MSKNERSLPDYKLIVNLKWWNMYIREKNCNSVRCKCDNDSDDNNNNYDNNSNNSFF